MLQSRWATSFGAAIASVSRPVAGPPGAAVAGPAGASAAGAVGAAEVEGAGSDGATAFGDGAAACGNGSDFVLGTGAGFGSTFGLACDTGGTGFGAGALDCSAAGAAAGAGLSSSAVMERDSSGRAGGSFRIVSRRAISAA